MATPPRKPAVAGAKDQVARLLTLVPYLHSHPEVRLDETARAVGSTPEQVVKDLGVLFMCGLPGGFPDDLIDVDLDALEDRGAAPLEGVIRLSNADYLARPLRLTPTEATAIIVALRALRGDSGADDPRGRRPHVGQARGGRRRVHARRDAAGRAGRGRRRRRHAPAGLARGRRGPRPPGPPDLLRAGPRRGVRAGRRPARGGDPGRGAPTSTPGATAPRRRACSGWTGSTRPCCSSRPSRPPREPPRDLSDGHVPAVAGDHPGDAPAPAPGPLGGRVLPGRAGRGPVPTAGRGRPPRRRRAVAAPAAAAARAVRPRTLASQSSPDFRATAQRTLSLYAPGA